MVQCCEFCVSGNAIVKKRGPETLAVPIFMCGGQSVSSSKSVKNVSCARSNKVFLEFQSSKSRFFPNSLISLIITSSWVSAIGCL